MLQCRAARVPRPQPLGALALARATFPEAAGPFLDRRCPKGPGPSAGIWRTSAREKCRACKGRRLVPPGGRARRQRRSPTRPDPGELQQWVRAAPALAGAQREELRAAVALRFARRLQAAQVPLFISGIGTNNLAAEIHHTAPTCGPSSAPSGRCSWSRTRRCFRACGGAAGSWAPARAGCSQRQRAPPAWAGHGHAALLFP
ncbi:unnamed protein product [Prorocentrum cordatum]|uniref:Uncharacterized protein n=1 Tax=Prorocentrum cordatum TaxID=2364126 RepID=A0ABN9PY66_9DINO|nr:unnamed protein product [Polarella glacialis]